MISTCQQLLKQQLLQIQCQSVTDMWMAAPGGRTHGQGPCDSQPRATMWSRKTGSVLSLACLPLLLLFPVLVSSLTLGALWFGWHRGFISIKLSKKGEMCAEHRETVSHQYIGSEGCRKHLNIHSHPQPLHPSFTQLWALPAAFQSGLKPLAKD